MSTLISTISFPERKIKILNADIEVDFAISDDELDLVYSVFNQRDMNPLIRLTLRTPSGKTVEFTNLNQIIP
jgi:hypothetical protein